MSYVVNEFSMLDAGNLEELTNWAAGHSFLPDHPSLNSHPPGNARYAFICSKMFKTV